MGASLTVTMRWSKSIVGAVRTLCARKEEWGKGTTATETRHFRAHSCRQRSHMGIHVVKKQSVVVDVRLACAKCPSSGADESARAPLSVTRITESVTAGKKALTVGNGNGTQNLYAV